VLTAAVYDGVFSLAQFFTPSDADLLERMAPGAAERARLVARLPEALFAPAPFSRVRMVNALLEAQRRPARAYAFLDTSLMSPPQVAGVPPLELAAGSPLQPFAEYCFACHRGNPAKRLDFMSGPDEATVLARLRAVETVRDVLDWERYRGTDKASTLMPPADSHQRAALEAALARDPRLLEEMRKVVPSLFDF
jgi:mono/diheme cytochrome c family protein